MTFLRSVPLKSFTLGLLGVFCLWSTAATADDKQVDPRVEHTPIRSSVGGLFPYAAGRWSLISINVSNPDEVPREIISSTYFDGEPTLQYGRRMWLPPRSRLHTYVPVLVPPLPADGPRQYAYHSLVFDAARAQEVLVKEDTGQKLHSGILPAQTESFVTGFLDDVGEGADSPSSAAYDLLVACRRSQNLPRRISQISERLFAPDDFCLQAFDEIVIASNRALGDPAGLAAVRRWVHGGGRLWVMLNQVDPQVLEAILGDEFVCNVVDRVGLTSVKIDASAKYAGNSTEPREFEEPVDLVRAVVDESDVDVAFSVNGWPAAFTKSFGRGIVLVTTLHPRAWIRPSTPEDGRRQRTALRGSTGRQVDQLEDSPFTVLPPMHQLSGLMMHSQSPPRDFEQILAQRATEYIGYSIPSRTLVGGLLAGFGCLVLGIGVWLWRRQTLEHLGWIGPVLGVGATAALLSVGVRNRHQIEPSVAAVQVVEALPGVDDANIHGGLAFYSPENVPWKIETRDGGRLTPEMAGLEGTTRRIVWSDLASWSWENLTLDTPQRTATYHQSLAPAARLEAHGTFGPAGLTGRVSAGDPARLAEAVLVTRVGRMGVDVRPDGTFAADADRVFSSEQYVEAGFLQDEQDRRRRAYPQVMNKLLDEDWNGAPLLMAWTSEPRFGFEFDKGRRQLGATLLAIPVTLGRPAAGTDIRIPAPLLPFRIVRTPEGNPSSPVWSPRQHEWQPRSEFSTVWMKFQVPRVLLPVEVTGARLIVQVTGPVVHMELFGLRRDSRAEPAGDVAAKAESIERWNEPVGSHIFELTDREMLQLADGGGLILGLTAGDPKPRPSDEYGADISKASPWQIVSLGLELKARVSTVPSSGAADDGHSR